MAEISAQMVKDLREKSGAGMMDCKKALAETGGDMNKAMLLLREKGAVIASKRSSRAVKEGLVADYITPDRKTGALIEFNCETDFVSRGDDFRELAKAFAETAAKIDCLDKMMDAVLPSGETVAASVQNLLGKIGENMMLTRWARLTSGEGGGKPGLVFSYIHPPGKIGVLVEVATSRDLAQDASFREFARDIAMHIAATAPVCVDRSGVPAELLEQERTLYRKQALNEGKPEKIVDKIVEGRLQKFYGEACLLDQPFAKNPDQTVAAYVKDNMAKFGDDIAVTRYVRYKLGEMAEEPKAEE